MAENIATEILTRQRARTRPHLEELLAGLSILSYNYCSGNIVEESLAAPRVEYPSYNAV